MEKETIWNWVKSHRKHLLIAGISVLSIIAVIAGVKNQEALKEVLENLKRTVADPKKPVLVSGNQLSHEPVRNPLSFKETVSIQGPFDTIQHDTSTRSPHDVSAHLRKLAAGRKASTEKLETASKNGFHSLPSDYTWVRNYRTGGETA